MTDYTPSRPGQAGGSDVRELFLKVFSGEVLTAFNQKQVMMDKHFVRTIESGKSAQFPVTWKAEAKYHTPGEELTGNNQFTHRERTINIDQLLVADTFIPRIDEAMNHYDVRSIYSTQLGEALANEFDRNVHIVGLKAAREAAGTLFADHPGGKVLTDSDFGTVGETLASGMFEAAQTLDEKDVPEDDRYMTVRPAQYYLLAQTTKVLNRDWGGRGSYAEGDVLNVAGINIVKSNNLPNSNITENPDGAENDYTGDFSSTVGLVHHRTAMGTVKLLDLAMENEWQINRQGYLMLAKFAMGHDKLRPEAAVEIATA